MKSCAIPCGQLKPTGRTFVSGFVVDAQTVSNQTR